MQLCGLLPLPQVDVLMSGLRLEIRYNVKPGSRSPIEKLKMKLTTNAEKNYVCPTLADSSAKAGCYSVSQHRSACQAVHYFCCAKYVVCFINGMSIFFLSLTFYLAGKF